MNSWNKNRAIRDHATVLNAGFADSKTHFEIGTAVNELGVANATRSKRKFDEMATATEVVERGMVLIRSENRNFRRGIDATQLVMYEDGQLGSHGKSGKLPLTEEAFFRLCSLVTPGGAEYLSACWPELRASNMNQWFPLARTFKLDEPRELSFWLRDQRGPLQGKKEIFGVFGSRYTPFGGDQILETVMDLLPRGSKATLHYDRYRGKLDVILHSDVKASDYVAGEYFKAGFSVRWADDGTGGISTDSFVLRNLCLNLICLANLRQKFGRQRHVGAVDNIKANVQGAIAQASKSLEYFSEKWSESLRENVLEKYEASEPIDIFQGLVYNRVVWMPGVDVTTQVARLMECFEYEAGTSKAHIINAVTRAAHSYNFENPWTQEELEEVGGELLYNRVWNVYVPDEERARTFDTGTLT